MHIFSNENPQDAANPGVGYLDHLKQCSGDEREDLLYAGKAFLDHYQSNLRAIKGPWSERSATELGHHLHSIRGVLGIYHAHSLAELVNKIELDLVDGYLDRIGDELHELEDGIALLVDEIKQALASDITYIK